MTADFLPIYDLYHEAILRHCTWKSRDADVGRDLTQETFLRFYICLQRDTKILNPRAFLYRIAHNLFINHVLKKRAESLDQLMEKGFEPTIDPWHQTYSLLDAERPLQKLHSMPRHFKQVLTRRFIQGLGPAEIAAVTGESANTVSVRIFRGLRHLRGLLDDSSPNTCTKSPTPQRR